MDIGLISLLARADSPKVCVCGAKPRYARCRGCSVPSNRAASPIPRGRCGMRHVARPGFRTDWTRSHALRRPVEGEVALFFSKPVVE